MREKTISLKMREGPRFVNEGFDVAADKRYVQTNREVRCLYRLLLLSRLSRGVLLRG